MIKHLITAKEKEKADYYRVVRGQKIPFKGKPGSGKPLAGNPGLWGGKVEDPEFVKKSQKRKKDKKKDAPKDKPKRVETKKKPGIKDRLKGLVKKTMRALRS